MRQEISYDDRASIDVSDDQVLKAPKRLGFDVPPIASRTTGSVLSGNTESRSRHRQRMPGSKVNLPSEPRVGVAEQQRTLVLGFPAVEKRVLLAGRERERIHDFVRITHRRVDGLHLGAFLRRQESRDQEEAAAARQRPQNPAQARAQADAALRSWLREPRRRAPTIAPSSTTGSWKSVRRTWLNGFSGRGRRHLDKETDYVSVPTDSFPFTAARPQSDDGAPRRISSGWRLL